MNPREGDGGGREHMRYYDCTTISYGRVHDIVHHQRCRTEVTHIHDPGEISVRASRLGD